jgi:hypothetical protein
MRPALDPAGHRVPRTKPICLLHTWKPHRRQPFALVLHLHQHQSSRNLHLQYLAKNQSTQRCQSLITQGSDHPPVLEQHMVLTVEWIALSTLAYLWCGTTHVWNTWLKKCWKLINHRFVSHLKEPKIPFRASRSTSILNNPTYFTNTTNLGKFLLKKQVIKIVHWLWCILITLDQLWQHARENTVLLPNQSTLVISDNKVPSCHKSPCQSPVNHLVNT